MHTKSDNHTGLATATEIELQVSKQFEWLYIFFSFWFLSGIYWDAWAHTHIPGQESFFSIYHLVMYTGATALSGLIVYKVASNYMITGSLSASIPTGYSTAFLGVFVFMSGGIGDMFWHELFGIENDLEASFSPTHILLMIGIQLFLVAPFYTAWVKGRNRTEGFVALLPATLSFGFLLSGLMVISQWAHPFVVMYATLPRSFGNEAVGILSYFVQTVFLMGSILLAVKERMLPAGAYTIALTINATALSLMRDNYEFIPIALFTGIILDFLANSGIDMRRQIRLVAAFIPLIYFGLYFVVLHFLHTLTWSMHLIAGSVMISVAISLFLSLLIVPPERDISQ